ncbi:kelch repeat-containing protein [Sorangium sp. So ce1128]
MLHERTGHVAMLMPDGRVLVAGGADTGGPLSDAEVYDPGRNAWLPVRPLTIPRSEPMGTSLEDGTVLVLGGLGEGGVPLATADLFKLLGTGRCATRRPTAGAASASTAFAATQPAMPAPAIPARSART